MQLLSFVAENERLNIRQRQAEGIAATNVKGVRFGRPTKYFADNYIDIYIDYSRKKITKKMLC